VQELCLLARSCFVAGFRVKAELLSRFCASDIWQQRCLLSFAQHVVSRNSDLKSDVAKQAAMLFLDKASSMKAMCCSSTCPIYV
jgi:hypothetical protein